MCCRLLLRFPDFLSAPDCFLSSPDISSPPDFSSSSVVRPVSIGVSVCCVESVAHELNISSALFSVAALFSGAISLPELTSGDMPVFPDRNGFCCNQPGCLHTGECHIGQNCACRYLLLFEGFDIEMPRLLSPIPAG
jgi:hypothetical protein